MRTSEPHLRSGRSPRVRGRRSGAGRRHPAGGKIPARAGTTRSAVRRCPRPGEDPRACGDDVEQEQVVTQLEDGRKIPARAGTTGPRNGRSGLVPEDPRACGDDPHQTDDHGSLRGRSPRVRGRRFRRGPRHGWPGKIPARAGTTIVGWLMTRSPAEDPRACGDDRRLAGPHRRRAGRSPRVRGRQPPAADEQPERGKIPARAGTTGAGVGGSWRVGEDPRACGDDLKSIEFEDNAAGRSPRVRGRRPPRTTPRPAPWKIPARAGTTLLRPRLGA